MSVNLSPLGGAGAQFFTNDGVPLTGGLLYTYLAGTSTPATTYTSSNGITALANPIILDAAGRVPTGEIWLSDGINYKFVLKDSTDVLIATWDGLSGINSNFIAYTAQEETVTATAGQTVFNLSIAFVPATNNLAVFVNGSNQVVSVNYTETDENTVTFLTGLNVGDVVKFSTATPIATNAVDAVNVSYTPAGVDAVTTNVQAKLRQYVTFQDFGAVGDGVADDTVAIQAAFDSGEPTIVAEGIFKYTSSLTIPTPLTLNNNATFIYGGTYNTSNPHFNIAADNVTINGGIFDGNDDSGSIIQFSVGADYGTVNNALFKNLDATAALAGVPGDFAAVVLKGTYAQVHDCVFQDLVNTSGGAANDSFPRAITITGDSNTVSNCNMNTVRDGILTTGDSNYITDIRIVTCTDNGLYYQGSNNTVDGIYLEDTTDEPVVFQGSNNIVKNMVLNSTGFNSIGFENATNAVLDGLTIIGTPICGSLFRGRTGNTASTALICGVVGSVTASFGIYAGTEGSNIIDWQNNDITYVKASGYDYNYFIRNSAGTTSLNNVFTMSDAAAYTSTGDTFITGFSSNTTDMLTTSLIQKSGSNFRLEALVNGVRFTTFRQNNINVIKSIAYASVPLHFWSANIPTTGTWKVGDTVWNSAPASAGYIGWVCTVAGTPGTWNTFGLIS